MERKRLKITFVQRRYRPGLEEHTLRDVISRVRIRKVLELVPRGIKSILDIGCYDGTVALKLKQISNAEIFGVDLNEETCKLANKRGVKCFVADVEEGLPFRDEAFDFIFAGEIIEHVYDPDFLVSEVYRILRRKGYFVLTTPNLASLGARVSLLMGKRPFFVEPRVTPTSAGHIRYFTLDDLVSLLEDNGFIVDRVRGSVIKLGKFYIKGLSDVLADLYPRLAVHLIVRAIKK